MAAESKASMEGRWTQAEHKHIKSHEQLKAVVNFIVDNHHAVKEIKSFSKNFELNPQDKTDIDKMVEEGQPIFIIVSEILERHHKNANKPPTLKGVAEIFTKMGLKHLADDIEKLWEAEEMPE